MGFQEESQSLFSRLHVSSVPRSALLGVGILALVLVFAMAGGLVPLIGGGAFTVKAAESEVVDGTTSENAVTDTRLEEGEDAGAGQEASGAASTASEEGAVSDTSAVSSRIYVHVDGAVKAPGVYALDTGARVADAVEAAGGLTKEACSTAINLAQVLVDGQQIVVPTERDVAEGVVTGSGNATDVGGVSGGSVGPSGADSASGSASASGSTMAPGKVNINTASAAELITLSGIGEATAAKIIAYRAANGGFAAIEDIKLVSGIGEKKFEALRDFICV